MYRDHQSDTPARLDVAGVVPGRRQAHRTDRRCVMVDGVIVTAAHNGTAYPAVVANHVNQCEWLVDVLLHDDGPHETWFYVSKEPVLGDDGPWPRRWMRIGHHNGFGAVFFHDDSTPP